MSNSATADGHTPDDSVRLLDVTGYGSLEGPSTLEVGPNTEAITFDVEGAGEEIAVTVDAVTPADVRVRSSETLTPKEAREVRAALDEALGEVES